MLGAWFRDNNKYMAAQKYAGLKLLDPVWDFFFVIYMRTVQKFKEKDKTFEITRHVSTETSVIFSWLMYKALSWIYKSEKVLILPVTTECT